MANRFRQIIPVRSNFVPKEFIPNFGLLAEHLTRQQQQMDATRSLTEIPIDALEGRDEETAKKLRAGMTEEIDGLAKIYQDKGLHAGNKARNDLFRKTKRRILPGGDIYDLAQRKKAWVDFQTKQSERFQKGEITREQYSESVARALNSYNNFETDNLSMSGRMNAVNTDEFSNKFLQHFTADQNIGGNFRVQDGILYYDNAKVTELQADKVRRALSGALHNAMSETGQLNDRYNALNRDGQISNLYKPKVDEQLNNSNNVLSLSTSVNKKSSKKDIKKLQETLKEYGLDVEVDGIWGDQTEKAAEIAKEAANQYIERYNSFSDEDFNNVYQDMYTKDYVDQLVTPYADAKSYRQVDRSFQVFGKTLARVKAEKEAEATPTTTQYGIATNNPQLDAAKLELTKDGKIRTSKYRKLKGTRQRYTASDGTTRSMWVWDNEPTEEELSIINNIKDIYKDAEIVGDNNVRDLTDSEALEAYNQMIEKQRSIAPVYNQYTTSEDKQEASKRVFGNRESKVINIASGRPIYLLGEDGGAQPVTTQNLIDTYGIESLDGDIQGKIKPVNPLGIPTGDYANVVGKDGKQYTIVIGGRSIEEDNYFRTVNELGNAIFTLQKQRVDLPNGSYYESIPVPQIPGDKLAVGNVGAIVKSYDEDGDPVNFNIVRDGKEVNTEYLSIKEFEDFMEDTNPYKNIK